MCRSHIPERLCNVGTPKPSSGVVFDAAHKILWSLPCFDKFNASLLTLIDISYPQNPIQREILESLEWVLNLTMHLPSLLEMREESL